MMAKTPDRLAVNPYAIVREDRQRCLACQRLYRSLRDGSHQFNFCTRCWTTVPVEQRKTFADGLKGKPSVVVEEQCKRLAHKIRNLQSKRGN